jgi:inosine-uridine nucleoside N-ribohydrolase
VERILRECPELNDRLYIYHLGLTTTGYEQGIDGGTNMRADPEAARYVYENAKHIWSVGLQTTLKDSLRVAPGTEVHHQLSESRTELGDMLRAHTEEFYIRRQVHPAMHDAVAVSAGLQDGFVSFQRVLVDFTEDGTYRKGSGLGVCTSREEIDSEGFMRELSKSIKLNGAL